MDFMNIIFSSDDETASTQQTTKIRKKQPYRQRPYYLERNRTDAFNSFFTELQQNPKLFHNYTRMSFAQFYELLSMVEPHILKQCVLREPLNPNLRLAVTLRYLATGESQTSLAIAFKCSQTRIHQILYETMKSIGATLKDKVFHNISTEFFNSVASGFDRYLNFPHCLGALGGKYVVIQAPINSAPECYNYKRTSTIVLMAISDQNYNFTWCNIGAANRQGVGRIFRESDFGKRFFEKTLPIPMPRNVTENFANVPYVFVADNAFAMNENMLKPFTKTPSTKQKIFNYRLSRAQRMIENCFGILAVKWQIFQTPIIADVSLVEEIIKSCLCLHNWLNQKKVNYITPDLVDREVRGEFVQGSWHNSENNFLALRPMNRNSTNAAKAIREQFTEFFVGEGHVEWQLANI